MADASRIEIGFSGGQVISVRLGEEALATLRTAVERGEGWQDLETAEGSFALDLGQVVFVRGADGPHTIGFSGG